VVQGLRRLFSHFGTLLSMVWFEGCFC